MKKVLILSLAILLSACSISSEKGDYTPVDPEATSSDETLDRFIRNAFVKEKGDHFIVYEYKEIRVDELAGLAARYCVDTFNKPAHLKSIRLHKNHSRLATFYCEDLKEQ